MVLGSKSKGCRKSVADEEVTFGWLWFRFILQGCRCFQIIQIIQVKRVKDQVQKRASALKLVRIIFYC